MSKEQQPQHDIPGSSEAVDGKFVHPAGAQDFMGQPLPTTFHLDNIEEPKEGQVVGSSINGQTLYWEQGQVVARG